MIICFTEATLIRLYEICFRLSWRVILCKLHAPYYLPEIQKILSSEIEFTPKALNKGFGNTELTA